MTDYRSLSGAAFQRTARRSGQWADAAMIAAEDLGYKIERDWIRSLLADATLRPRVRGRSAVG